MLSVASLAKLGNFCIIIFIGKSMGAVAHVPNGITRTSPGAARQKPWEEVHLSHCSDKRDLIYKHCVGGINVVSKVLRGSIEVEIKRQSSRYADSILIAYVFFRKLECKRI